MWLVFWVAPIYGKLHPLVYLTITAIGGAFLVNTAQGVGSAIAHSLLFKDDPAQNQFLLWPLYVLIVFMILAALFQISFLNKSLQYFSASIVNPVNYVFFSTATIITSYF